MNIFTKGNPSLNAPASEEQIRLIKEAISSTLPEDVIAIWRESDGALFNESGVLIYGTDDIIERNATYEVSEYAPGLLLIGDDSGGQGFFVSKTRKILNVIKLDLGALGAGKGDKIAESLVSWVQQGCPTDAVDESITKSNKNVKYNIVLKSLPKDGMKGMLLIKQKLALQYNASQLKSALAQIPHVLLTNVYSSKYKSIINEINQNQDCLELTPILE